MMINKALKNLALPFPKEVYLHDRYLHLLSELFGYRSYVMKPLNYYRQHSENQIGSRKIKILSEIFYKRYYNKYNRILIKKIYKNFSNKISFQKREIINSYLKITSSEINKIKKLKLLKENNIYLSLGKKFFLILKG